MHTVTLPGRLATKYSVVFRCVFYALLVLQDILWRKTCLSFSNHKSLMNISVSQHENYKKIITVEFFISSC